MNRRVGILLILGCALIFANGCSKTAAVKSDEGVVPASANSGKQPDKGLPAKSYGLSKADAAKQQSPKQASTKDTATPKLLEQIPNAGELKIALQNIYFDFDSSGLSQDARKTLLDIADKIKKDGQVMIRIEGNCDERGSDEYNLALGERRAKSALQYLTTLGVPEKRLSFISYGKEKPVDLGHDESSWAKNRRDEFVAVSK